MKITVNNWKTKPFNEKYEEMHLNRIFDEEELKIIKKGHLPEEMEDKWFVYYENNRLYVHRS